MVSTKIQVNVTEVCSVLASFKLMVTPEYVFSLRNCNTSSAYMQYKPKFGCVGTEQTRMWLSRSLNQLYLVARGCLNVTKLEPHLLSCFNSFSSSQGNKYICTPMEKSESFLSYKYPFCLPIYCLLFYFRFSLK